MSPVLAQQQRDKKAVRKGEERKHGEEKRRGRERGWEPISGSVRGLKGGVSSKPGPRPKQGTGRGMPLPACSDAAFPTASHSQGRRQQEPTGAPPNHVQAAGSHGAGVGQAEPPPHGPPACQQVGPDGADQHSYSHCRLQARA